MISDAGVRGLLVHVRAEGYEIADDRLVAEAGLAMAKAATVTADAGLSGLEFGLAIPGNVGGAVWANAGAHDSDVAAVLESAAVLARGWQRGSPRRGRTRPGLSRESPQARRGGVAPGGGPRGDLPPRRARSRP